MREWVLSRYEHIYNNSMTVRELLRKTEADLATMGEERDSAIWASSTLTINNLWSLEDSSLRLIQGL